MESQSNLSDLSPLEYCCISWTKLGCNYKLAFTKSHLKSASTLFDEFIKSEIVPLEFKSDEESFCFILREDQIVEARKIIKRVVPEIKRFF